MGVEGLQLTFTQEFKLDQYEKKTYDIQVDEADLTFKTDVQNSKGEVCKTFRTGQRVTMEVSDWLSCAGIDSLDAVNSIAQFE